MTKSWLSAVVLACAIPQLCAAAAALVGDRSVHAESGPAQQEASSLSIVRPMPVTEIDALIRKEVLNDLARALESQYAIPDTAKKLAETVRAKQASNAYKKITAAPEFARALTDDLYAVAHDKHLRVGFSFAPLPQGTPGPPSQEVLNQMRKFNGAILKVEILDGNVGYMRVNGVPPVETARSAVAAAFAFLQNTDALIIDNRGNGGGDPNTVAVYVSYLSEGKPYIVNTFHWRAGNRVEEFKTTDLGELAYGAHKPVFVLTSPATFSGGEELTYDLQVLKRALVVGEVTGGGANPGGPVPLGHQFFVNMPGGQAVNPVTGTSWEGVGVKPDIPVSAAAALSKAHELAIDQLIMESSDPMGRSMLKAVAMKLQTIGEAESGSATRLANVDIVGTYALESGQGSTVTILEKDGRLMEHMDGIPDVALTLLNGNRYKLEGVPDGAITSFRIHDGKTELLREAPFGPPTIRAKQPGS
jgi:retinol-binding protein 3